MHSARYGFLMSLQSPEPTGKPVPSGAGSHVAHLATLAAWKHFVVEGRGKGLEIQISEIKCRWLNCIS